MNVPRSLSFSFSGMKAESTAFRLSWNSSGTVYPSSLWSWMYSLFMSVPNMEGSSLFTVPLIPRTWTSLMG